MSRSKHYSDFSEISHGRSSEYNYEREVYVDDQCCQNCRYWCDWDPDESQNGCKKYGREDYEQKPVSNWCMDWQGKSGNRRTKRGGY